jgi:hypothetical protein
MDRIVSFYLIFMIFSSVALTQELPNIPSAPVPNEFAVHKTLHVVGGFAISNLAGTATNRPWLGFAAGVGAGLAKETHDKYVGGAFSGRDVALTTAGALAGYAFNKWVLRVGKKSHQTVTGMSPKLFSVR